MSKSIIELSEEGPEGKKILVLKTNVCPPDVERSRLVCRRLGYCNSALLPRMCASDRPRVIPRKAALFVCASTGEIHHKLYASHEQYPAALFQFLLVLGPLKKLLLSKPLIVLLGQEQEL